MPLRRVRDYVENLKAKPTHVRERAALGASAAITAVIAIGWLVALSTSGTLALGPAGTPASKQLAKTSQESQKDFSNLLGAAGAFQNNMSAGQGSITVVETNTSSTLEQEDMVGEQTVIPF
mgnify:CR=1 FL=1